MRTTKNKILAVVLALALVLTLILIAVVTVFAANLTVTSEAEFASALASAAPGDTIVIGTTTGTSGSRIQLTLTGNYTIDKALTIDTNSHLFWIEGALTVTNDLTVISTGTYNSGLLPRNGGSIKVTGGVFDCIGIEMQSYSVNGMLDLTGAAAGSRLGRLNIFGHHNVIYLNTTTAPAGASFSDFTAYLSAYSGVTVENAGGDINTIVLKNKTTGEPFGVINYNSSGSGSWGYREGKQVVWTGLTANGSSRNANTTELTFTFDIDPGTLTANDITITGATKGALSGTGTTRKLAISNIEYDGSYVQVSIADPAGFAINTLTQFVRVRSVEVYMDYSGFTAPVITAQPSNRNITVGSNTTFTVTASGNPVPNWYWWEYSTDGGENWYSWDEWYDSEEDEWSANEIHSGGDTTTLTLTNVPLSYNGYQYRCWLGNPLDEVVSNAATLTVTTPVAPTITTASLPGGTVGTAYNQTLAATGDATITWSVASGNLPGGLSLSAAGAITGTPTTAGTFTFTIKAANGVTPDATKELSIIIAAHTHTLGTEWQKDASGHWKTCSGCTDKVDFAEHTPGDWKVTLAATATADGSRQKECSVCGYITVKEVIQKTGDGTTPPDTGDNSIVAATDKKPDTTDPTVPRTGDDSNITLWILLGGASLITLGGMTVMGRKRKRYNKTR